MARRAFVSLVVEFDERAVFGTSAPASWGARDVAQVIAESDSLEAWVRDWGVKDVALTILDDEWGQAEVVFDVVEGPRLVPVSSC